MRRVATALFSAVLASRAGAQTVNRGVIWGGAFGDDRFAPKTALYWDLQVRRADFGLTWQQILTSIGVTRDLSAHWRATVALGGSHRYRYGAFPARSSSFEAQPWLMFAGTYPLGSWTWSQRARVDLRMIHPIGEFAPADADWAPTIVRFRRFDRFQHSVAAHGAWYVAGSQELFINLAPAQSRAPALDQFRWQAVLGHQLTPHNRLEAGYGIQRINRRGGIEMNHILLMNLRSTVPLR
jgi:Protein of unknown function (DUF2490)